MIVLEHIDSGRVRVSPSKPACRKSSTGKLCVLPVLYVVLHDKVFASAGFLVPSHAAGQWCGPVGHFLLCFTSSTVPIVANLNFISWNEVITKIFSFKIVVIVAKRPCEWLRQSRGICVFFEEQKALISDRSHSYVRSGRN